MQDLTLKKHYHHALLVILACSLSIAFSFGCGSGSVATDSITTPGDPIDVTGGDDGTGGNTGGDNTGTPTDEPSNQTTVKITSPLSTTQLNANVDLSQVSFTFDRSIDTESATTAITMTNVSSEIIPTTQIWQTENTILALRAPVTSSTTYYVNFSTDLHYADGTTVIDAPVSYEISTIHNPLDLDGDNFADLVFSLPNAYGFTGVVMLWSGDTFEGKIEADYPLTTDFTVDDDGLNALPLWKYKGNANGGYIKKGAINASDLGSDGRADLAAVFASDAVLECATGTCTDGSCIENTWTDPLQTCTNAASCTNDLPVVCAGGICTCEGTPGFMYCRRDYNRGACQTPVPSKTEVLLWNGVDPATTTTPNTRITIERGQTLLPYPLGDVNGDHLNDLAIYSTYSDGSMHYQIKIFLGRSEWPASLNLDTDADASFDIPELSKITPLGDINNDGKNEIALVPYDSGRSASFPSLWILNGVTGATISTIALPADTYYVTAAGNGDVNGDGIKDLLIAPSAVGTADANGPGKGYVIFGRSNFPTEINLEASANVVVDPGATTNSLGDDVLLTDVSGDGIAEIIIASNASVTEGGKFDYFGKVFIFNGSTSWGSDAKTTLTLDMANSVFSNIISSSTPEYELTLQAVGDVNNDGYPDLFINNRYTEWESGVSTQNLFLGGHEAAAINSGTAEAVFLGVPQISGG